MNDQSVNDEFPVVQRVGLFGGAFDPPHAGHLSLAAAAIEQFKLDVLHVVPTGSPPHRSASPRSGEIRLQMAKAAFADMPEVCVDAFEMRRSGPSYSIDTALHVQALHPQAQLFLLLGQDQFEALPTWKDWQRLAQIAIFSVASRSMNTGASAEKCDNSLSDASSPGSQGSHLRWHRIEMPEVPISSSALRTALQNGNAGTSSPWLAPGVYNIIQQRGLYA